MPSAARETRAIIPLPELHRPLTVVYARDVCGILRCSRLGRTSGDREEGLCIALRTVLSTAYEATSTVMKR
jgi:hypothetical protein